MPNTKSTKFIASILILPAWIFCLISYSISHSFCDLLNILFQIFKTIEQTFLKIEMMLSKTITSLLLEVREGESSWMKK